MKEVILNSPNKHQRTQLISILVIHYTEITKEQTINTFMDPQKKLSSHLMIDTDGTVYRFVEDDCVAYHAGQSYWYGRERINEHSIGIELVHPAFSPTLGIKVKGDNHLWTPYDSRQIDSLIRVCNEYSAQYAIVPSNIVGHSDVAPWRYDKSEYIHAAKTDPGPLFPWRHLYNHGVGQWYTCDSVADTKTDEFDVVSALHELGYRITNTSETIRLALRAFQMHYRPCDISGLLDQETLAIISALLNEIRL